MVKGPCIKIHESTAVVCTHFDAFLNVDTVVQWSLQKGSGFESESPFLYGCDTVPPSVKRHGSFFQMPRRLCFHPYFFFDCLFVRWIKQR